MARFVKHLWRALTASWPTRARLRSVLVVGVAYFLCAAASVSAFGTLTTISYSNAIVLVALLRTRPREWVYYLACAWVADWAVVSLFGHGPGVLIALCDSIEVITAAALVHRTGRLRAPVFADWQVPRVMLICALAPLASAALAAWALHTLLGEDFAPALRARYNASALGLVIGTPFLLGWASREWRRRSLSYLDRSSIWFLACGGIIAGICAAQRQLPELLFLTFPVVVGLAWAYGFLGASVGMASVVAASLAALWAGPAETFRVLMPHADVTQRVAAMQIYLIAILVSTMLVAVIRAQQKTLEQDLRAASAARTEFLAAMSHEIRTPMTGMLGMADLLAEAPLSPELHRYAAALKGSGRHLLSVINDILDFSRIESGALELEQIDFALDSLAEELRSLMNPLAVEQGIRLELSLEAPDSTVLRGDPTRLRQVLLNLIGNAIKFTECGRVSIRVVATISEPGAYKLDIEVRDTGVGIAPEKLDALFSPFMQADRTISRKYGGSGLGLAICKRLVQAMGGQITVESTLGRGSCFRVEVNLAAGTAPAQDAAQPAPLPLPSQRILVAEDAEVNRQLLEAVLSKCGHQVTFAENGRQAVELASRAEFDLILMDVQMPVMDGVEATRQIRATDAVRSVPIIGLTANVMAHERERFLSAGMNDCLGKPIQWDRLSAAIARYARQDTAQPSASEPPDSMHDSQAAMEPLIDGTTFSSLNEILTGSALSELLERAMRDYAAISRRFHEDRLSREEIRREAHRIRGSSGSLGLARISALAAQLEKLAQSDAPAHTSCEQLRRAVEETALELSRRGQLTSALPLEP